jgi:ribonuclease HI
MDSSENNWQRMLFKKNKVWVALDSNGHPLSKEGKALIKYQLDQDYEYWVYKKNIQAIEDAPIKASKNKAAPPPKITSRKDLEIDQPVDCEQCICLFTDGASSGNPGPSGIGILMRYKTHQKKISRYIGLATNNIAELEAIRVGLEEIKNKNLPVRVFTDSSYALGLLSKGWKPKKNQELVAKIRLLMDQFKDLGFIKVKGHTGHPENECADQLATSAITANM